jgi:hypothetical protein
MAQNFEDDNEISSSVTGEEFLDYLTNLCKVRFCSLRFGNRVISLLIFFNLL